MEESWIYDALLKLAVLVFSLCLHEFGHAWAANQLGDPTAKMMGRLTLDPRVHADPLGTILFPLIMFLNPGAFLFGWAKPVPVTVENLTKPRRDGALVALAGPAMNLLLAFTCYWVLHVSYRFSFFGLEEGSIRAFLRLLDLFIGMNLGLAIFNLLPVHPLDGSWILKSALPPKWSYQVSRLDPYGFLALLAFFFILRGI